MTETRTQIMALTLIFLASVAICIGEMRGWVHLVDFANNFGGAGIGLIVGHKAASALSSSRDATINLNPPQA